MNNPEKDNLEKRPPALPSNVAELLTQRKGDLHRTLNDRVEALHLSLYDGDEHYKDLLYAVYDEQAVEGSLAADNILAAEVIRDKAKKTGDIEVGRQKLATIAKALGVVLRRYGTSRKERRDMIGGKIVPPAPKPEDNGD
jgi:hypothetical protein